MELTQEWQVNTEQLIFFLFISLLHLYWRKREWKGKGKKSYFFSFPRSSEACREGSPTIIDCIHCGTQSRRVSRQSQTHTTHSLMLVHGSQWVWASESHLGPPWWWGRCLSMEMYLPTEWKCLFLGHCIVNTISNCWAKDWLWKLNQGMIQCWQILSAKSEGE